MDNSGKTAVNCKEARSALCCFRAELCSFSVRICPKNSRLLFRRERGDDLFKARIAAQRVPIGVQTEFAISWPAWNFADCAQLFQGEIRLAGECVDSGEISH